MRHQVLHLSHSATSVDGGIATAVAELRSAQRHSGLTTGWLTADSFPPRNRDRSLRRAIKSQVPDVLHLHGLWRSPTRIASGIAGSGLPLVISPHGMLDPGALAISSFRKQIVWNLWERQALQSARCLHALCNEEAKTIRALLPKSPIAVIPSGVELPGVIAGGLSAPWADAIPAGAQVLLFLGRFHSKKGIEPLLEAWDLVADAAERSGWWLALVGYGDNGELAKRVAQAHQRGKLARVRVFGPVFGLDKAVAFNSASAFVLPSFSEGLPMAVLEAMASRLPCLLSEFCNIPAAFRAGAAIRAKPEPVSLSKALLRCFRLSALERTAMGASGQVLVSECFSWTSVVEQTRELYAWVLGGGEPPAFVDPG